jgi:phage pi2 protein 07
MTHDFNITIEIMKGGYVLHYPVNAGDYWNQHREIFSSSRKMNQRIKEVLEKVSPTPVDAD